MRPTKIIAILFCFAITIFGCKKNALDVYPDLNGRWNSESYTDENGNIMQVQEPELKSYYTEITNGIDMRHSGKAKIKKNLLTIGEKQFEITRFPSFDNEGNFSFDTNVGKFIGAYAVVDPIATVNGTSVTFGWTITTATMQIVDSKIIDYRQLSSPSWISITCDQYAPDYTLQGLLPLTTYEWRIRTIRGTHFSQYSAIQTFTTN
jgi:hypothetical protein